jgi:hypothetical protein
MMGGCPPELKRSKPDGNHHLHLVLRSRMQGALFPRSYTPSRRGARENVENETLGFVNVGIMI